MKYEEKIQKIKLHLSKNEIEEAVKMLLDLTHVSRKDLYDEILIVSSRHEKNQSELRQGIEESQKINIENARVIKSLLQIVNLFENGEKGTFQFGKFRIIDRISKWVFLFISAIAIIMGLFFLYFRIDVIMEISRGNENVDYSLLVLPAILIFGGLFFLIKVVNR